MEIATDGDIDEGVCVGTFRWKRGKVFPVLDDQVPPGMARLIPRAKATVDKGWAEFLASRLGDPRAIPLCQRDMSLIDGLSFPITLLHILEKLAMGPTQLEKARISTLNIVIMGASYKAEVRIFEETDYWSEVQRQFGSFTHVQLWFVGPELEQKAPQRKHKNSACMHCGTAREFLQLRPDLINGSGKNGSQTVLVGYNPGFGSGCETLLKSWLGDLAFICQSGLPCIFTQANDYSDLRGEFTVLRSLVGAKFLLTPCKNKFHMAMTACADSTSPSSASWSCGNSYFYVVKGKRKVDFPSNEKLTVCSNVLKRFGLDVNGFAFEDISIKPSEVSEPIVFNSPVVATRPALPIGEPPQTSNQDGQMWGLD
mmetsp:Transcript_15551/g.25454  ORF Transcript_15551/g.25454 Transcript_15551/m.25454 type:complete len:369 (+) Transcript_15551:119-1225(+)